MPTILLPGIRTHQSPPRTLHRIAQAVQQLAQIEAQRRAEEEQANVLGAIARWMNANYAQTLVLVGRLLAGIQALDALARVVARPDGRQSWGGPL